MGNPDPNDLDNPTVITLGFLFIRSVREGFRMSFLHSGTPKRCTGRVELTKPLRVMPRKEREYHLHHHKEKKLSYHFWIHIFLKLRRAYFKQHYF